MHHLYVTCMILCVSYLFVTCVTPVCHLNVLEMTNAAAVMHNKNIIIHNMHSIKNHSAVSIA